MLNCVRRGGGGTCKFSWRPESPPFASFRNMKNASTAVAMLDSTPMSKTEALRGDSYSESERKENKDGIESVGKDTDVGM